MSRAKVKHRWYRWRTCHAHGRSEWTYLYGDRKTVNRIADEASDGIRGYDAQAIKLPPRTWLLSQRDSALDQIEAVTDWHRFLDMTLRGCTVPPLLTPYAAQDLHRYL